MTRTIGIGWRGSGRILKVRKIMRVVNWKGYGIPKRSDSGGKVFAERESTVVRRVKRRE